MITHRHQDVGAGEIDDEIVGDCPHPLVCDDGIDDERVAADRQQDDRRVHHDDDRLRRGRHRSAAVRRRVAAGVGGRSVFEGSVQR